MTTLPSNSTTKTLGSAPLKFATRDRVRILGLPSAKYTGLLGTVESSGEVRGRLIAIRIDGHAGLHALDPSSLDIVPTTPPPVTHHLKCWPEYLDMLIDGRKRFEVRKDDRGFRVGDTLHLRGWSRDIGPSGDFDGREHTMRVTMIMHGSQFGIADGHVLMGVEPATIDHLGRAPAAASHGGHVSKVDGGHRATGPFRVWLSHAESDLSNLRQGAARPTEMCCSEHFAASSKTCDQLDEESRERPLKWRMREPGGRTVFCGAARVGIFDTRELAQQVVDTMNDHEEWNTGGDDDAAAVEKTDPGDGARMPTKEPNEGDAARPPEPRPGWTPSPEAIRDAAARLLKHLPHESMNVARVTFGLCAILRESRADDLRDAMRACQQVWTSHVGLGSYDAGLRLGAAVCASRLYATLAKDPS